MKLSEWNRMLEEGRRVADQLTSQGIPTKSYPYTMFDQHKGLKLSVMDDNGDFFYTTCSGMVNSFVEMQGALARCAFEIKKNVT